MRASKDIYEDRRDERFCVCGKRRNIYLYIFCLYRARSGYTWCGTSSSKSRKRVLYLKRQRERAPRDARKVP